MSLATEVEEGLETGIVGRQLKYLSEVESTNSLAVEMADDGAVEGTVILAEMQTHGKGWMDRRWISPKDGIWLSVILRPIMSPAHAYRLTIAAGLAVAKTIRSYGIDARVKWPNDVIIREKKVCGVLTEIEAETALLKYAIVGIGVDVNVDTELFPEEIRVGSTSLKAELGHPVDRVEFLQRLFAALEYEYLRVTEDNFQAVLNDWRHMLATVGKRVQINTPTKTIYGEAIGVDSEGSLIVECKGGFLEKVVAGECIHLERA